MSERHVDPAPHPNVPLTFRLYALSLVLFSVAAFPLGVEGIGVDLLPFLIGNAVLCWLVGHDLYQARREAVIFLLVLALSFAVVGAMLAVNAFSGGTYMLGAAAALTPLLLVAGLRRDRLTAGGFCPRIYRFLLPIAVISQI